ncbi:MAG: hypothetical protein HY426_01360 [Candidatus Levybacteria bacterium]|nr:hypothetical protein [Candidatus Levybacteria bacterium]
MEEFNTVLGNVTLSGLGNHRLFDGQKIYETLTAEMQTELEKHGVRFKKLPLPQLGGGGSQSILLLLREFLEYKDLSLLVFAFNLSLNIHLFEKVKSLFQKNDYSKPRIRIMLVLEREERIHEYEENLKEDIVQKLLNLKDMGTRLFTKIQGEYPLFLIDQEISIRLYSLPSEYNFIVYHEAENRFNNIRIKRFMRALNLTRSAGYSVIFKNNLFVQRLDGDLEVSNDGSISFRPKKAYYFLFSTKLIKDYVGDYKSKLLKTMKIMRSPYSQKG